MLQLFCRQLAKVLGLFLLGLSLSLFVGSLSPGFGLPGHTQEVAPSPVRNPVDSFQQGREAYQNHQLEESIALWEEALDLYRVAGDLAGERSTLVALGAVHVDLEAYEEAIAYLEAFQTQTAALENIMALPTNERLSLAQGLSNLGLAYTATGQYASAIETQEQALHLMQSLGESQLAITGQVWGNLGNAYEAVGDYDAAMDAHQNRRVVAQALADEIAEAEALSNLGVIYANQGDYDTAIAHYLQSFIILKQAGLEPDAGIEIRQGQAHLMLNLASAYHAQRSGAQGNLERARGLYIQSLNLARELGDRSLEAKSLGGLGMIQADLGNLEEAIELQREGLSLAQSLGDPELEAVMTNNLGHTLFVHNDYREAERLLRQAITHFESLRPGLADLDNVSLFDSQIFSYNLLQQILVAQEEYAAALEISEQGRARAFLELLSRRQNPGSSSEVLSPVPSVEDIRAIARRANATLVEYSIVADDDFKFQGRQRGPEAALFIWVVSPSGEIDFRQVDLHPLLEDTGRTSLANLVAASRQSIGVNTIVRSDSNASEDTSSQLTTDIATNVTDEPNRSFERYLLRQLHSSLIEPIADLLPPNPNDLVVIVPQDSLFLIPFSALQEADRSFFLNHHTSLTVPSIQVLGLSQSFPRESFSSSQSSILLAGNPTMPTTSLAPLPYSEQEVQEIGRLLQVSPLLGDAATETSVRALMPTAEIIHLATHGLFNYGQSTDRREQDIPGAIVLAPQSPTTSGTDGFLTSAEILDFRLNADLVVLSACNTGRGEITGDGVVGLSRSFLSAGTRSVAASLWAVADDSTAFIMTHFYENLRQGQSKVQALRQAMLTAQQAYYQPFNWAAFTLIGAPD